MKRVPNGTIRMSHGGPNCCRNPSVALAEDAFVRAGSRSMTGAVPSKAGSRAGKRAVRQLVTLPMIVTASYRGAYPSHNPRIVGA